jgi:hypothetical protein
MDGRIPAAAALFAAGVTVGLVARGRDTAIPVQAQSPRPLPTVGERFVAQDDCARELSRARAELRLCEKLAHDLDVEVHGVPLQWDDEVPAELAPDQMKAQVERAIDECKVPLELIDWDCTEPPCFARARTSGEGGDWSAKLIACMAWAEAYDEGMSMSSGSVDCPNGEEGMVFFTPYIDWLDDEEKENWGKRFHARADRANETWPCLE